MLGSVCSSQLLRPESFPHNPYVTESAARLWEVMVSGQVTGALTHDL